MITGSFPARVCGVGDYTARLVGLLNEIGIDTSVLTTDEQVIRENSENFDFSVLPTARNWAWGEAYLLIKTLRHLKPDIVHIQYQTSIYNKRSMIVFLPLLIKMFLKGVRVFTTLHDIEGPYLFPGARRLKLSRLALLFLLFSDNTIISSVKHRKSLSETMFLMRSRVENIEIMPIGSTLSCETLSGFDPLATRKDLGFNSDTFLIATFGFIEASRDYKTILKAVKILTNRDYNIHLIAIGGKSKKVPGFTDYYRELQSYIECEGLSERVTMTGYLSNSQANEIVLSSDLGILLFSDPDYLLQSCSFPFLLSHSLPVIIAKGTFLSRHLKDGKNVVFTNSNNPEALANNIEGLLRSKEQREKIGKNARQLYKAHYSFDVIAQDLMVLYKQSLAA